MTLNPAPPNELQIFTQSLRSDEKGRIVLRADTRLQHGINARWQGIVAEYPRLIVTEDGIGKLVRELFEEFQKTNSMLQLKVYWILRCSVESTIYGVKESIFLMRFIYTPKDELIEEYWRSFFYSIALRVSIKISRTIGLPPSAVRGTCICTIGNLSVFYKTYKNTKLDRELLSDLKSYAYNKIKNSSYPDLRVQFSDDTIGRGNPGMITHYKSSIADALQWVGQDESTNEILCESTIERKVNLCKWTIEYLRAKNKTKETGAKKLKINELKSDDFKQICNLYCDNTSEFEYLRKINKDIKNKKEKLTIKELNLSQKEELKKLRRQLNDELPQSMEDELDNIGAIIRRFIKRDTSISIDAPIGADNESLNIGCLIPSEILSPQEAIESQEINERSKDIISMCNEWLGSESIKLTLRQKQMLYLTYHHHKLDAVHIQAASDRKLDVVYEQIAPIFDVHYTNISRPVRNLIANMADFITRKIDEQDGITDRRNNKQNIIKETNNLLKAEFDRLEISKCVNLEAQLALDPLIQEYKQYLEELREEYYKFKSVLGKIRTDEYQKQLEIFKNLNREEYPDLNRRLERKSFEALIKKIKVPLSKLWDH